MQCPAETVNNEMDDVQEQVEVTEINCNNAWIYWGAGKWVGNYFGWLLVLNGRKTRYINPEKQKFNSRHWCKSRVIPLKVMELRQGKTGGKFRPNYILVLKWDFDIVCQHLQSSESPNERITLLHWVNLQPPLQRHKKQGKRSRNCFWVQQKGELKQEKSQYVKTEVTWLINAFFFFFK